MTDQELNKAVDTVQERIDAVNLLYIRKIAAQIHTIGELNPTSVNRLTVMSRTTRDIEELTRQLAIATALTIEQVQTLYEQAAQDTYSDPRFKQAFVDGLTVPQEQQTRIRHYTQTVATQTAQTLENLSNTTAIEAPYRAAVDRAIYAVSSGAESYTGATRDAIKRIGYAGLQVQYESGYHKRLDTAIRQNIIDGVHQIAQHSADLVGESLGYDAIELSAHENSAPDHEPMQGRIFLKEEFAKMQSVQSCKDINGATFPPIKRAIGEWHCRHFAMPYSTTYSKPRYSLDQLQKFEENNHKGCEIDGKHVTMYQASQIMRRLETEVRRWKDVAVMAQAAQDDALRRECQMNINKLMSKYNNIVSVSGLPARRERTFVDGFRAVKLK